MNRRQKIVQQRFLDNEKVVIDELEKTYSQALDDVNERIRHLDLDIKSTQMAIDMWEDYGGSDAEKEQLQSMLRSKVYQKQYQEALQGQIDDVLDNLHHNSYNTIDGYLKGCYDDGFIGTLYDLQGQGVPLIMPIDQEAVVRAVQLDSKISGGLYSRMGEDVTGLKKVIASEVSRGIATGMTYDQVAKQISYKMVGTEYKDGGALARAKTIARTEGHRIQCQAGMDACYKARDIGADVLKQWDATLDARTRESHQKVDGEVRELDDKFSNGLMFPGDPSGRAAEVVNCRCALLQRARWALKENIDPDTGELTWTDDSFTKMNNFTKEIENFESLDEYDEFKKAFWSKENQNFMDYNTTLEERYGTKDFEMLLGSMTDEEYKRYIGLFGKNPIYNKHSTKSTLTNQGNQNIISVKNCANHSELNKYMSNTYGIKIDSSVSKLDFESVSEGIQGIERVLQEFPQAQSHLKSISTSKSGIMCAGYRGTIDFNPKYFNDRNTVLSAHPTTKYYIKNNSVIASGAHETGHILEVALIERDTNIIWKGSAWRDCTKAKEVVSEACKSAKKTSEGTGKLNAELKREISGYATTDASECMAEAVSDYIVNGNDAAILSKEIWKILKRELG